MKGYKAFNKGFRCKDMQYEIGKEYSLDGELEICEKGFHFCKNLIDVFGYYTFDRDNTVLAEVEALGEIQQEGTKYCTNRIKIVREVSWDEVDKAIVDGTNNTGYRNSGNYNSGDCNSGFFNSDTPRVRLFNQDSGMTFDDIWDLGINWSDLEESKDIIQKLPNYDAHIFFETTGIDWREE